MRQETFAILFLMRKGRPKKNGLAPIFARITTGGLRQEVYTQCDSNPETWNQHKERAMGTNKLAIQVNERLNDFRVKIIDIRSKLQAEGFAANAAQIKQRYLNPTCNTMMLIAGLTDYVKRRQAEVGVRITQRTADKYERLLRYLKQYLAKRGKEEDIPVERMNYEFLDGFNLFLQTAHRCRHNGAVAVMDCLRNFTLYCLRNEWITKNPFRYYKLKEDVTLPADILPESVNDYLAEHYSRASIVLLQRDSRELQVGLDENCKVVFSLEEWSVEVLDWVEVDVDIEL